MAEPDTPAGRDLLRRHPDLSADEIGEVELQARGRGLQADADRRERVVDALRHLLTDDQRAAITAVLRIDPDVIASLDDAKIRLILGQLADPRMNLDREAREAASKASQRYLDEIM
ncbi:MAG: hypothetical protein QOJ75_716 [Chloroflexota bacterium]|nr:hypothetical protein [Chloroflexota bacterium]